MPASLNISLPVRLREYVFAQVETRRFRSASEFIQWLIRKDMARSCCPPPTAADEAGRDQ